MADVIENALQIASLLFCMTFSLYRIAKTRDKSWVLLFFFYASYLMGDLYWQAFIFFFGSTPSVSVVSDLSWFASFMFLYLLLYMENEKHKGKDRDISNSPLRFIPFIGPVFSAIMTIFYMSVGSVVCNFIYGVIMAALLYILISTIIRFHGTPCHRVRWVCHSIAMTSLAEYGAWTSSAIRYDVTMHNPYYWFTILASLCLPVYLYALSKEVEP